MRIQSLFVITTPELYGLVSNIATVVAFVHSSVQLSWALFTNAFMGIMIARMTFNVHDAMQIKMDLSIPGASLGEMFPRRTIGSHGSEPLGSPSQPELGSNAQDSGDSSTDA